MELEQIPLFGVASGLPAVASMTLGHADPHSLPCEARGDEGRREPSLVDIEKLFSELRGNVLLLAMLAFDHQCSLDALIGVRLRDINIAKKTILVSGVSYLLNDVVLDDVKDQIHERLCGFSAVEGATRWEAPLFTEEERLTLIAELSDRNLCSQDMVGLDTCLKEVAARNFDESLGLSSPLNLLDKGPRIVRRRFGGLVDAYYVWRRAALTQTRKPRTRKV